MYTTFSKGLYDPDGDIYDEGIYIHCRKNKQDTSETFSIRFDNIDELKDFIDGLNGIVEEIENN